MSIIHISIIIPTYNERNAIINLLPKIVRECKKLNQTYEIVVVDDNSPDHTAAAIQQRYAKVSHIHCYRRLSGRDLGKSILLGIQRSTGDVIIGMDADGNHDPTAIPSLLNKLASVDFVIGSRFVKGGGMQDSYRYVMSYVFNTLLRFAYRYPAWDNTSGYYAIRRKDLNSLHPSSIYFGYGEYALRLLYKAFIKHLRIAEIPVYYPKRIYGQSKSKFLTMIPTYLRTAQETKNLLL